MDGNGQASVDGARLLTMAEIAIALRCSPAKIRRASKPVYHRRTGKLTSGAKLPSPTYVGKTPLWPLWQVVEAAAKHWPALVPELRKLAGPADAELTDAALRRAAARTVGKALGRSVKLHEVVIGAARLPTEAERDARVDAAIRIDLQVIRRAIQALGGLGETEMRLWMHCTFPRVRAVNPGVLPGITVDQLADLAVALTATAMCGKASADDSTLADVLAKFE